MPIEFRTRTKSIQPNPSDIGACCVYNETTSSYDCFGNVKYIDCKRDLGIFRGKDSNCDDNSCPTSGTPGGQGLSPLQSDQHGACKTCSTCTDNVLEEKCITQDNFDAEFFGGKVCTQVVNQKLSSILTASYGCCIDDGCFDTCNPSYCSSLGGILHDGVNTDLAMNCNSNPCSSMEESNQVLLGACCKSGSSIGNLTKYDCERNYGSWKGVGTDSTNYSCSNDALIGSVNNINSQDPVSSVEGFQIVCSKPTPRKYYNMDGGLWNNTIGPTYGREAVIVELHETAQSCEDMGGIVSATDGDIDKAIMWGGCQWHDGNLNIWKCESKTYEQCAGISGSWTAGIYCDDIRSAPASGLYFAEYLPQGVDQQEKYLAGRCYIIDKVTNPSTNPDLNTKCADYLTEYQCAQQVQVILDRYLIMIEDGTNVGWDESNLGEDNLTSIWEAGKRCSDCVDESQLPITDYTVGLCILDPIQTGSYMNTDSDGSFGVPTDYNYKTSNQSACMSGYNRTDCLSMHGTWINTCDTCEEHDQDLPIPVETGSCCQSSSSCLDGKTYSECENLVPRGYFHGPGTTCVGRDCSMVAYLDDRNAAQISPAKCSCKVSDNPNPNDDNITEIFANSSGQGTNLWSGSTCGDSTVNAVPYWRESNNFATDILVNYRDNVTINGSKFINSQSVDAARYNIEGTSAVFRNFITTGMDGGTGSFLDEMLIQNEQTCYFRVDDKAPILIPKTKETLSRIYGKTLQTNQPAKSIYTLILNHPRFGWDDGPIPRDRKITFVNLAGMEELRIFAVQGNNWTTLQSDFESKSFPLLRVLDLRTSNLEGLDLTKCEAIEELNLNNNNITTLDLSGNDYMTNLDVSYNKKLSTLDLGTGIKKYFTKINANYNDAFTGLGNTVNPDIGAICPQLVHFSALRCRIADMEFSNMPYLEYIDLTGNSLETLVIERTPSIETIALDSTVTSSAILRLWKLPDSTNRTINANDWPTDLSDAVIPDPNTIRYFTFKKNTIPNDGVNTANFIIKLAKTTAITSLIEFDRTTFPPLSTPIGSYDGSISSLSIDFSNAIALPDDNGTTNTIKEFLLYLFGTAELTDITHDERIEIRLTNINKDVQSYEEAEATRQIIIDALQGLVISSRLSIIT